MKRLMCAGLVALTASLAACATPTDESADGAGSAHSTGEVIPAFGTAFHWAEVDESAVAAGPSLATDDPLTVRLQAWADRMHALVVEDARRQHAPFSPPRPQVHVATSGMFNAWAAATLVDTGATFDDGPGYQLLSTAVGSVPVEGSALKLQPRPTKWPEASSLVDVWNASSPACALSSSSAGRLSLEGCETYERPAGRAAVLAASPHIYLTTQLVARLDEKAIVSVLAHELGHYYRAHASSLTNTFYGFWYTDRDERHRAVPASRQHELFERYASVFAAPTGQPRVAKVYHERMLGLLGALALGLGRGAEPAAEALCPAEVPNAARESWLVPVMLHASGGHEPIDRAAFARYEGALASCAGAIHLGARLSDDTMLRDEAIMLFQHNGFANLTLDLMTAPTLGAALELARVESLRMDQAERDMLDQLREANTGFYTYEQEADEIMFEMVTRLGMSADDMFDAWLSFMTATEQVHGAPTDGDISAASCRTMLEGEFKTIVEGRRRAVYVPLGALSDSHHPSCYRLFNLWNEHQLHAYTPHGVFTPPEGPSFAALRAHAASLIPEGDAARTE